MVNEKQKSSSQPGQLETTFKSDFDDLNIISYNDNNNFFVDCQDSFSDDLFIKNIYNEKKQNNVFLSDIYKYLSLSDDENVSEYFTTKSNRVFNCGSDLIFSHFNSDLSDKPRLYKSLFCRDRFCPICTFRRSVKIFSFMKNINLELQKDNYKFLFLTLTVPNVSFDNLQSCFDELGRSLNRFLHLRDIKNVNLGVFKSIEITFNRERKDFHPHIHLLMCVNPSYFSSRYYLSHTDILILWRSCCRDDNIKMVNIKKVNEKDNNKHLLELCKYPVKSSDYLFQDDFDLSIEIVNKLRTVLFNRRLFSLSGVFKDKFKELYNTDNMDYLALNDDVSFDEIKEYIYLSRYCFNGSNYIYHGSMTLKKSDIVSFNNNLNINSDKLDIQHTCLMI